MNARTRRGAIIAVALVVIAVALWPSRPSDEERVEQTASNAGSVTGGVSDSAAPGQSDDRRDWFPDLTDTPSTITTGESASGRSSRFDCSGEDLQWGLDDEERDARNALLAETLSRSANAEDQLAAAIIRGPNVGSRIDNLQMALEADPLHPLVLWQVADDCRRGRGGEYCRDSNVRANLETVLGGNGWYWVQVAAFYQEQGMLDESLAATQRAVSAPEFHDYWIDHIQLLERAFAADSDRSYLDRVVDAMGYAAAMPSDLLIRQCVSLAEMDDGWLDACTVLARRYEREGTSLLTQLIGLTMQEDLYALSGLTAEVRDAELRRSELESLLDRVDANYQLVQALDPQVYARYLDVWATSGERAALEFGLDATEQLLADPDYDPCVYMPSE